MAVVPKVVVVGAGFGGLEVARDLKGAPVEVTLVDQHNFHTFQPLLYQVATAGLNAADVAHVVRGLFHRQPNVRFRQGRVTGVDWDARTRAPSTARPTCPFDHLVLAGGATVTYFGTPGAAEHGFPLYTLDDATRLRNHVAAALRGGRRRPDASSTAAGSPSWSSAAGPTGVETAGALAELFAMVFRKDYPGLDVSRARVVLVEMQDHLLHPFTAPSRRHALDTLRVARRRGAARRPGRVGRPRRRHASPTARCSRARRSCGRPACRPTRWPPRSASRRTAAAASSSGPTSACPAARARGRSATSRPPPTAAASVLPQLAPVAMQSRPPRRPPDPPAARGPAHRRRSATATRAHGHHRPAGRGRRAARAASGCAAGLAWLAWLGLHLVFLVGQRNRASVLLNWAWNYLTWDRGPRLIDRRDAVRSARHDR